MKGSFLKVSSVLCSALLLSACSSTSGSSSREVERVTDHYELMPVTQYDYEWDDNKSFAMNAMLSMGIQGNVYETRNVEDTYTYYSGGQRAGSAAINFLGMNLGSAIADVANTGRANREAASVPPHAGFFVPKHLIVDDAQQSFLNVRDYIYEQVIAALQADFPDIQGNGVYTGFRRPDDVNAVMYFSGPECQSIRGAINARPGNPSNFVIGFDGPERVEWCAIDMTIDSVIENHPLAADESSILITTQLLTGNMIHPSIWRHADVLAFNPHRYRSGSRTYASPFPYMVHNGEARLFTRDNATVPINKPNL